MPALRAFLMTDIVGSTRATRADSDAMQALLGQHDEVLSSAVTDQGGRVFKHTGDGICAVFDDPAAAVTAAVEAQRSLVRLGVDVRMGIDVGVAHERGDDYFGLALNRCSRVMDVAHGGQILSTSAVEELSKEALASDLSLLDLGAVRLRDFDGETRLFQVAAPQLREGFPPLRSGHMADQFPTARTALIGRARELAELEDLVIAGSLVTVVGPGGSGKTRLALEALADRHDDLGGGAFADLSLITDAALLETTIANAVRMPVLEPPDRSDVVAFLAERSMLLVIDNCEHVVDSAAHLCDDVLNGCPGVALLCTSRAPLHVAGERVMRLEPLAISDAAALLVDRAARAGAHLLTERDGPLIEEICTRLDGMPLAIEVVAAQTAQMALSDIRALLDERFQLLVDAGHGVVPRHQTIEATLAWSYDLLRSDEQRLLRALSVFSSSFTLADAAAVGGFERLATTARELAALVDKSLVVLDDSTGRYRLLETVRSFASARSSDADEADVVLRRLYDHMLAEAPGPWSCWLNMTRTTEAVVDLDNMQRVLEWCVASGRPEDAAALTAANLWPWFVTGRAREALHWLDPADETDDTLPLDDRLARATATIWLAKSTADLDVLSINDAHLLLAPADHPAQVPLMFLKAWTLVWIDRDTSRRLLAAIRTRRPDDAAYRQECEMVEGWGLLLDDRPAEATSRSRQQWRTGRDTVERPNSAWRWRTTSTVVTTARRRCSLGWTASMTSAVGTSWTWSADSRSSWKRSVARTSPPPVDRWPTCWTRRRPPTRMCCPPRDSASRPPP